MLDAPEPLHTLFLEAVALLGGQRVTARAIGCSERTLRDLCSGRRMVHDGFLRDAAAALVAHADRCRDVERRLNPLFAANRPAGLPRETGRRTGARWNTAR